MKTNLKKLKNTQKTQIIFLGIDKSHQTENPGKIAKKKNWISTDPKIEDFLVFQSDTKKVTKWILDDQQNSKFKIQKNDKKFTGNDFNKKNWWKFEWKFENIHSFKTKLQKINQNFFSHIPATPRIFFFQLKKFTYNFNITIFCSNFLLNFFLITFFSSSNKTVF